MEKAIILVFIVFSILVTLTLRGCVKMVMRGCPLCKRRYLAISLWARYPLLRLLPCHLSPESCLNGRAYAAAAQTVASLHTMAVLQVYQTDLLKDLGKAFYKVQVWARTTRGPSPSRSGDQRWAQMASLATHAPPPPAARARERRGSERGKTWKRCSRRGVLNFRPLSSGPE